MQSFNQAREEIDSEKVRAEAAASILAKKTKAMQEQVQLLCPIKTFFFLMHFLFNFVVFECCFDIFV